MELSFPEPEPKGKSGPAEPPKATVEFDLSIAGAPSTGAGGAEPPAPAPPPAQTPAEVEIEGLNLALGGLPSTSAGDAPGPAPSPAPPPAPAPAPAPIPEAAPLSEGPVPGPGPSRPPPAADSVDETLVMAPGTAPGPEYPGPGDPVSAPDPAPPPGDDDAAPPPPPGPASLRGFKDYFKDALAAFKRDSKKLAAIMAGGLILSLLPFPIALAAAAALSGVPAAAGILVLLAFPVSLFGMALAGAALLSAVASPESGIQECFRRGKASAIPLWVVFALMSFIVTGGLVLFVVPAVLFMIWFFAAPFVLIKENELGMNAILKSRAYVRGHEKTVFLFLVLCWAITTGVQLIPVVGQLAALVLGPVLWIFWFKVYEDLKAVKGDFEFHPEKRVKFGILAAALLGFAAPLALAALAAGSVMTMVQKGVPPPPTAVPKPVAKPPAPKPPAKPEKSAETAKPVDLAKLTLSNDPIHGRIHGKPFEKPAPTYETETGMLILKQDGSPAPGVEVQVLLDLKPGEVPTGMTFVKDLPKGEPTPEDKKKPHAHAFYMQGDQSQVHKALTGFQMKAIFSDEKAGKIPARIFLQFEKDIGRIEGRFEALVIRSGPVRGTSPDGAAPAEPEKDKPTLDKLKDECTNELGIYCYSERKTLWSAFACLKKNRTGLLKPCRKYLINHGVIDY